LREKTLPAGIGFGELALMYGDKRTATVTAIGKVKVWVLDGLTFKNIVVQSTLGRKNMSMQVLDKFPIFAKIDVFEKTALLDGMSICNFIPQQNIIR
jgi:CRP-like cAMP-binding protein